MRRWTGLLLLTIAWTCPAVHADGLPGQYIVTGGDTLTRLAQRFGISVDALRQANPNIDEQHLGIGATLNIPVQTYVVGQGDTLFSIARQRGVPVENLRTLNHLSDDRVGVGQSLALPPPVSVPSPASTLRPSYAAGPTSATGGWLQVHLPDGSSAWAPRDSLLLPAASPLTGSQVVSLARRLAGVPYVWGGTTPNGVDCSGFVQTIFSLAGYQLPRTADVQFQATHEIARDALEPGDLVFFTTYLPGPSHVGIYVGDGRFIHASSSRGVTESALTETYYAERFLGGRRLPQWAVPASSPTPPPLGGVPSL